MHNRLLSIFLILAIYINSINISFWYDIDEPTKIVLDNFIRNKITIENADKFISDFKKVNLSKYPENKKIYVNYLIEEIKNYQIMLIKNKESQNNTKSENISWENARKIFNRNNKIWKKLGDLSKKETWKLVKKVFGNWVASELLINLDKSENWNNLKAVLALANHEYSFNFTKETTQRIWTFQISWANIVEAREKYRKNYIAWVEFARKHNINTKELENINKNTSYWDIKKWSQSDLLAWIWYVYNRWWNNIINRYFRTNISNEELFKIVYKNIQWGSYKIWEDLKKQFETVKIDTTLLK